MARVATAYVEIRPDLKEFGAKLKAELKKVKVVEQVKIEPNVAKFFAKLKAELKAVRLTEKVKIEPDMKGFAAKLKADTTAAAAVANTQAKANSAALAKVDRDNAKSTARFRSQLDAAASRARLASERAVQRRLAADASRDRALTARFTSALATTRVNAERAARKATVVAATKAEHDVAAASVAALRTALRGKIKATRTDFDKLGRNVGVAMERQFGAIGGHMGRAMVRDLETEMRKVGKLGRLVTPLAGTLSRVGNAFGKRSLLARGINLVLTGTGFLLRGVAKAADFMINSLGIGAKTAEKIAGSTVAAAADLTTTVADDVGKAVVDMSASVADAVGKDVVQIAGNVVLTSEELAAAAAVTAAEVTAETGGVGGLVIALVSLIAVVPVAAVVLTGLQVVLGAILAIIIPLVAGIIALVGELVALGGVVVGSLGLLPGLLGAAVFAFGPLILVASKFKDLMKNTTKVTGKLFDTVEHLKNAIFAVISKGFVDGVAHFVSTTLPKLFGGIEQVAGAWNHFLTGLLALAATPVFIHRLNVLFELGARFINAMYLGIVAIGDGLSTMATVGAPAVTTLLGIFVALEKSFSDWSTAIAKSGEMATFFDALSLAVQGVAQWLIAVARLTGAWLTAVMGPATAALTLFTAILDRWTAFNTTPAGQALITAFFTNLNTIMKDLSPVMDALYLGFLNIVSVFTALNAAAAPVLTLIIGLFSDLITNLAPGVITFLNNVETLLADPTVQKALGLLASAVGDLIGRLTIMNSDSWPKVIAIFTLVVRAFIGAIIVINALSVAMFAVFDAIAWVVRGIVILIGKIGEFAKVAGGLLAPIGWVVDRANDLSKKLFGVGDAAKQGAGGADAAISGLANSGSWAELFSQIGTTLAGFAAVNAGGVNPKKLNPSHSTHAGLAKATGSDFTKTLADMIAAIKKSSGDFAAAFKKGYAAPSQSKKSVADAAKTGRLTAAGFLSNFTPALIGGVDWTQLINKGKAYDQGVEVARYLAKGITSGAANLAKVSAFLLKGGLGKQVTAITAKIAAYNAITRAGHPLAFWQTQLAAIVDFKAKAIEALAPHADLVGVFGFLPTPAEVAAQLQTQLDTMRKFTSGVAALVKGGLSTKLAGAWLTAGAETAGNLVEGLAGSTPAQLATINKLYTAIGTESTAQADSLAASMFGAGQATVQGYINGILAQQKSVGTAIQTMLNAAIKAAKKALGIKSPSTVFGHLGVNSAVGYIQGVAGQTTNAVAAVNDLFSAVTNVPSALLAPIAVPSPSLVGSGALDGLRGTSTPAPVNVAVYLGTREITDILRVLVDGVDTTNARALLAGRRGG